MKHARLSLVAIIAIAGLGGCSEEAPEASTDAVRAPSTPTIPDQREHAYTAPQDAGPGMTRLMEAYEAAPKIPGISHTERLAKWAKWAEEHMPDATERERVYAAYVLSVEELKRERGPLAATPLSGLPLMSRLLEAWRIDANGDGKLDDAELDAAATLPSLMHWPQGMRMTPAARDMRGPHGREMTVEDVAFDGPLPERPTWFMLGIADTDGDGRLTEAEWARAIVDHTNRAEARARAQFERLAAARLDANDNGRFDDGERAEFAGWIGELGLHGLSLDDPWLHPHVYERLLRDERMRFAYPDLAPMVKGETVVPPRPPMGPASATFGLVGSDSPAPAPDLESAAAAFEAFEAHRRARQRAEHESRFLGFVATLDTDADGGISTAEWERGLTELPRRHEREVLLAFYDTNADGTISDTEIADFMRWHDNKGVRADANFDGKVDHLDVIAFVEFVKGQ